MEFIQSCDRCAIIDPDQIHERVTLRINESARPTVDGFSPYLAPLALDLRLTWSAIAVAPGSRSAEQTIDPRDEPRRLAHIFAVAAPNAVIASHSSRFASLTYAVIVSFLRGRQF